MSDDTAAAVLEILSNHAQETVDDLSAATTLEALGIDSLALVEIIFDLEEKFDITIPDPGEMEGLELDFKTTGDVIGAVQTLIEQKQG